MYGLCVSVCLCASGSIFQILDQLTGGGWCNWGAEAVVQPVGKEEIFWVVVKGKVSLSKRVSLSICLFY